MGAMQDTMSPSQREELIRHWPIVLAAALGVGFGTMGIGFYSLGLYIKPVQAEFGWTRAQVSGAAMFQQLGIFLSAPLVGRMVDRVGVRWLVLASYLAMPLALLAMSLAHPSVWQWYGLWLIISLAGGATTPAVWARMVAARFDKARGLALGLMLVGTGLAAALVPALLGPMFAADGWRQATRVMAGASAEVGLALSLTMKQATPMATRQIIAGRFEWNRPIGITLLIAFLVGVVVAGLIVHLVPMLVDRGMAPVSAASMAASIGVAVIMARVVVGWLFDRFHAPYVSAAFMALPSLACVLLLTGGPVLPAALMLGLAAGAEVDMLAFFTSRYAAMRNYGATYGVILGVFCLGAALGPSLFGVSVDTTGGYRAALIGSAVALVLVVVLIVRLGPYRTGE